MKILVPYDGSPCAQNTLNWAAKMFKLNEAEFFLLTVIAQGAPELLIEEYQVEDALKVLAQGKQQLESLGAKVIKTEYMTGDTVASICDYAATEDVDQVILGSHGRSGLAKILLGSVSTGVLEHCKSPVIIHKNI